MLFRCLSEIIIEKEETWSDNNLFVTLDFDWANDSVLLYAIDLLEKFDIAATWFVTHDTPLLKRLRANQKFELAIHPNFNQCLFGDNASTVDKYLDELRLIVPEAVSMRSHSLTKNSLLSKCILDRGFTHESNVFINDYTIPLKPYVLPDGLVQVCYNLGDYSCLSGKKAEHKSYLKSKGLKVLNFHPIHLFLNTKSLRHYGEAKAHMKEYNKLKPFINKNDNGIRNYFEKLILEAKNSH